MFRFLELELHGWDFWPSFRVPLDSDVVILSGPNGSGKTTIIDAVRQLLHAPRLSQNRRLTHYLRQPNRPVLLRAVVSNRLNDRDRRPFDRQQVFTDEATLACALVPDGGSPEKRFVVLPGRVAAAELQERLLNGRDYLRPDEYRRVLEYAGASRSLMHILALEQGRADELSRQKPRDLFHWVMEARGSQQVLERYKSARLRFEDSLKEVERQQGQVIRQQSELGELDRQVRRLDEFIEKRAHLDDAEKLAAAARFQARLTDLREIDRKLPELRTRATNLATTTDRIRRQNAERETEIRELHKQIEISEKALQTAQSECDDAVGRRAVLQRDVDLIRQQADELAALPEEDVDVLRQSLTQSRMADFESKRQCRELQTRIDQLERQIADLERGVPVFPPAVEATMTALAQAGISASLAAEHTEVVDDTWSAAIEAALGPLRYSLCVGVEEERRAAAIAREHNFPGPIVCDAALDDLTAGPVRIRAPFPRWLAAWVGGVEYTELEYPGFGDSIITRTGLRRDSYGVWVSGADTYVLGASAVRAQLTAAREQRSEALTALEAAAQHADATATEISSLESRLATQEQRERLANAVSALPHCERELRVAQATAAMAEGRRDDALAAVTTLKETAARAALQLEASQDDLSGKEKELESTHAAVAQMELRRAELEPDVKALGHGIEPELRRRAENGELSPPELAERSAEQARQALTTFQLEGPIPPETVREERRLLQRVIEELQQHVRARQAEADAAQIELNHCRNDYLDVVRSTLNDYAKRARQLAALASARLEVELPHLENNDRSLDEAGIVVRIGFDGKPPTEIADTSHSGGQQVICGLILLMAMAETEGETFFIVDEPFAHLSMDRVDDVGKFLKASGSQFLITVPTTLDRGQLDPASLLIVLKKKAAREDVAPRPLIARA